MTDGHSRDKNKMKQRELEIQIDIRENFHSNQDYEYHKKIASSRRPISAWRMSGFTD